MKESTNAVIDGLKSKEIKRCIMCNNEDSYNICFKCDGIISAQKAFKRYFIYNEMLYRKYQNIIQSKKGLNESEKLTEVTRIMNTQGVTNNLKEKEIKYKKEITDVGIDGLTYQEQQIFFTAFAGEYKKLKENYGYACKKIGYDPTKEVFYIKNIDFAEQLRHDYKMKERVY